MPKTTLGRILLGFFSACLVAALAVVGSVWIEFRFPSDDARRVLLPGAQHAVTKPIVNAIGRQVERAIQRRNEARYMDTGLTLDETIMRFLDERVDLVERRNFAYRLVQVGSPECIAALLKVFQTAPPEHKAFMAQLIGSTGNPKAKAWLLPLLDDANPTVMIAAIRGLSAVGGADVVVRIAGMLTDNQRPQAIRVAAALGLGTIGTPAAREALLAAFATVPEPKVAAQILSSLGRFEFSSVAAPLNQYITAPDTPHSLRVTAVEALANSTPDAAPFLLSLASTDRDSDVRAAAAWAISVHNSVTDLGPALTALAEQETDVDVRRRLYEALLPQTGIGADRLLPMVMAEQDIAARVAGFNAVGRAVKQQPTSALTTTFDDQIVPELVRIATTPNSANIQIRAVFALRRAQTPAAQAALATIASRAVPQVATAARNGLPKGS